MKNVIALMALVIISGCASWQPDYPVSVDTSREIVSKKAENAITISEKVLSTGKVDSVLEIVTTPEGEIVETVIRGDQFFPKNVVRIMEPMPAHKGEGNVRYTIEIDANAPR